MPVIERRRTWRLTADPPPEGWRCCAQWFRDDGTLDVLYTNAPKDVSPYHDAYEHVFVNYTPVEQVRTVTVSEWADVR